MKKLKRTISLLMGLLMVSALPGISAMASLSDSGVSVDGSDIPDSEPGKISYSDTYDPIRWIRPGTDGRNGSGNDPWRNGLVTGNGQNGLIDDGAPENGTLIYQNMQFNFPSNDQRETPELASVMDEVKQTIVNGGSPSSASSTSASSILNSRAGEWSYENGLTSGRSWSLKNTYTFHPGMQLRLEMNGLENGAEDSFYRYTNYETAEIGAVWSDENGEWERKSFSSREDNVTITSVKATDGNKSFSMDLSIDDISDMSSENKMSGSVEDLRYKKFYKNSDGELYIGSVAHYPNYENSELKDGGFAGVSKIIVKGDGAAVNITDGAAPVDDRTDEQKNNGVPNETVINVSGSSVGSDYTFNADPTVSVTNAEEIIIITKSARDKEMGAFDDFADATSYALVGELVADTNSAAAKYTTDGVFSYDAALAPHAAEHGEIFGRAELNLNASEADRALANEDLIAKAKTEGESGTLNLAMLERMYYNGRYANVCCSGYQVPRLGGMWTGAWKVEWSGDYTTDANINLQVAGNNIGAMPESSQGFINFLLRTASDWEINAKQVYGIDDAIFIPTRIDGDRAMIVHFSMSFPGHIWNSGASWILLPVYEYWQCYGNQQIPLADDVRELLEVTDNTYNMATQWYSDEEPAKVNDTVYNLRNTLGLTDERAAQILEQGYFDLEKDILFPLLTKTCNFYTGLLTPEYYTKDGNGYYEEGKTELAEDEYYMFVPSYSPENCPEGYSSQSYLQMNASMDIAAARDCFNMAQEIVAAVGGENIDGNVITADPQKWQSYKEKLPPYLYEPTGELKEWAISDYGENYAHRHISQLYGLWPGYEANNDPALFDGAKALIATKNSYPSNDNVAGHSWVHKGLISARAKSSEGVKDALAPIVSQEMHYNSMMTAHNTSGNQAYCTDGAITPPAILIESLLYSDDQTVEILPAVIDETFEAGGSVTGLKTRSGGDVSELKWTSESAEMTITSAEEINLKCGRTVESVTINGEPAMLESGDNGEPYVKVSGENVNVVFSFAEIDNGTYTLSAESGGVTPQTSIDASAVVTGENAGEAAKWNIERKADGTYTIENALHGRYLVNNGSDVYMKRAPGQDDSMYWRLDENGYIAAVNGQYLRLENGALALGTDGAVFTFTAEPETLTQYSADAITISTEADLSQPVNPGTRIDFTAEVTPAAAESKTIVWNVRAEDGTQLTRTQFTDNTLRIGTDALSKTLIVTAQSEDGACVSNELRITVSDTVQDELKFSPVQDVFVSGWSNSSTSDKDTNYGDDSHDYLTTTNTKNTDKKYALIKFDIPTLGAEVKEELSSELVLTYMEQTEPDGVDYYAYEYTGDWDESSVTWNSISGDSYNKGDAIAEGVYDRETKRMSFALPADYIKNNSGKTVTLLIDSPDAPGVRTFWYSRESGDENTAPVINFSYIVDTTQVKTVTYGPYWADEVENHQGSSGDDAENDFGNFKNVDDEIKVFFPNAEDGATIGSFKRINGIDNGSSGGWKGYVTKTIDAEGAGDYTIYALGNTNAADRSVEITNETTGESAVSELSADLTEYSTSNYMRVFSVELRLERDENILRIQAPEGKAAPNFIALLATGEIYGSSEENPPTATPTTSAPTPTATIAPTQAPTAAPTTTPTAAPTATPTQAPAAYEIISYSVTNDGEKAVVESANVRAEDAENVTLYTAAYNDEGVLVGFAESAVERSGESLVAIGLETDPANTVKMFLWRDMQPLTEEKNVALDAE